MIQSRSINSLIKSMNPLTSRHDDEIYQHEITEEIEMEGLLKVEGMVTDH